MGKLYIKPPEGLLASELKEKDRAALIEYWMLEVRRRHILVSRPLIALVCLIGTMLGYLTFGESGASKFVIIVFGSGLFYIFYLEKRVIHKELQSDEIAALRANLIDSGLETYVTKIEMSRD